MLKSPYQGILVICIVPVISQERPWTSSPFSGQVALLSVLYALSHFIPLTTIRGTLSCSQGKEEEAEV